jgi:hypothetical protein
MNALFNRSLESDGSSCFTVNQHGLELARLSSDVLPQIEAVLLNVVEPVLRVDRDGASRFLGLDYVLGVYLVIGNRYAPSAVIDFLEQRSPNLQEQAIACAPAFFQVVDGKYNFDVPPSRELLEYVRRATANSHSAVRNAALRAMGFLTNA